MALADARRYLELVADVPRPDDAQTARFIDHVVGARAWREALPTFPPGEPIVLYLDPSGAAAIASEDAAPAAELRARFGYWAFSVGGTPSAGARPDGVAATAFDRPFVRAASGEPVAVPDELRRVATCRLTCWIDAALTPAIVRERWHARGAEIARFARYAVENRDDPEVRRYQPLLALALEATAPGSDDRAQRDASPGVEHAGDWVERVRSFHDAERRALRAHLDDAARRALWYYRLVI